MRAIKILEVAVMALLLSSFLLLSAKIADNTSIEIKYGNNEMFERMEYASESYRVLGDEARVAVKEFCNMDGVTVLLSTKRLQDSDLPDYHVTNLSDVSDSNDDWYLNPAGHFLVIARRQADGSITVFIREEGDYYY